MSELRPSERPERGEPWPREGTLPASRTRLARGILLGSFAAAVVLHLGLPPATRGPVWTLSYLILEALASGSLAARAWLTRGEDRLAWSLLALSAFLEVPNLLIILLQGFGHLPPSLTAVCHLLTLATGGLVLAGVLSFPIGKEGGRLLRRRLLDGLIFATSALFLLWVMGLQSSLRSASEGIGVRMLVDYLNVALLGGGIVFMTSYHPEQFRGVFGWLGASALAWLAAISSWTLAGLPTNIAPQPWIVFAGAIPLFQGLAAWAPGELQPRPFQPGTGPSLVRLIPYLPVLGALLALAGLLLWAPLDRMRGAFGIFLAMVALLLLRQFGAILDLVAARRNLEDRVEQRTRALEQAQDTLLRTERMNTVALMGAGLAHDLNNLLSAMKSSAELAAMNLEDGQPPVPRDLERIITTADRASMLTRRLMGFVRKEGEELAVLDLGRELREIEGTLRILLPRSVDLRLTTPGPGSLRVRSSRLRLEQMLVNLVANARDAMPSGGRLSIHAAPGGPEGSLAVIQVEDTGTGMGPELLERIFEPFFTTKAPGQGTGLGLSSLKALVEETKGQLEVTSQPGRGTCFRILLPCVQGA